MTEHSEDFTAKLQSLEDKIIAFCNRHADKGKFSTGIKSTVLQLQRLLFNFNSLEPVTAEQKLENLSKFFAEANRPKAYKPGVFSKNKAEKKAFFEDLRKFFDEMHSEIYETNKGLRNKFVEQELGINSPKAAAKAPADSKPPTRRPPPPPPRVSATPPPSLTTPKAGSTAPAVPEGHKQLWKGALRGGKIPGPRAPNPSRTIATHQRQRHMRGK